MLAALQLTVAAICLWLANIVIVSRGRFDGLMEIVPSVKLLDDNLSILSVVSFHAYVLCRVESLNM